MLGVSSRGLFSLQCWRLNLQTAKHQLWLHCPSLHHILVESNMRKARWGQEEGIREQGWYSWKPQNVPQQSSDSAGLELVQEMSSELSSVEPEASAQGGSQDTPNALLTHTQSISSL